MQTFFPESSNDSTEIAVLSSFLDVLAHVGIHVSNFRGMQVLMKEALKDCK